MMNRTSVSFLFLFLSLLISSLAGCGGEGSAGFSLSPSNNEAGLESISVTPTNTALAENTSQQFTATGIYSDNTTKDLTSIVIWTSSNEDAVTVVSSTDEAGLTTSSSLEGSDLSASYKPGSVKGKQTGKATITAKWKQVTGSAVVTVTSATLVSIAVTPTNPSIARGAAQQFTATGTYSFGTTQNLTTAVTWSSSTTAVAAISNADGSKGLATSVTAGSTTITATLGSVSGEATLTVVESGSVSLTWDAPTTNTDGSFLDPLTGLATYKIYYGAAPYQYTQVVTVSNPGATTITKELTLSAGTYYIAVTTVNISGAESDYSNEVIKIL